MYQKQMTWELGIIYRQAPDCMRRFDKRSKTDNKMQWAAIELSMGHGHRFFTSYVAGNLIKVTGPYLLKVLTVVRDEEMVVFGTGLTESHHGITQ
jgi:hypothetical protein